MSFATATSIFLIEAACWASLVSNFIRSSLVTPSTIEATSCPNTSSMRSNASSVSSRVS